MGDQAGAYSAYDQQAMHQQVPETMPLSQPQNTNRTTRGCCSASGRGSSSSPQVEHEDPVGAPKRAPSCDPVKLGQLATFGQRATFGLAEIQHTWQQTSLVHLCLSFVDILGACGF